MQKIVCDEDLLCEMDYRVTDVLLMSNVDRQTCEKMR